MLKQFGNAERKINDESVKKISEFNLDGSRGREEKYSEKWLQMLL